MTLTFKFLLGDYADNMKFIYMCLNVKKMLLIIICL